MSSKRLDLRKVKVLLVDDNPHALELLAQILLGFRVEQTKACRSAAEARELIASSAFDIIIVDGEMPNEDGVSLTRHVRRLGEQPNAMTPIILLSGHTPMAKVLKARDAGANTVVKKPVAPAVLLNRIERLARHSREFIVAADYIGPDRRFRSGAPPEGVAERRADALALIASPERAMSQDDVNALFG